MQLFDTHFHYSAGECTPAEYAGLIADTAGATGMRPEKLYLMAVGGNYDDSCGAQKFAETVPDAFFAVGVHPHEAENNTRDIREFVPLGGAVRCRAIGELGLDYYYDTAPRATQRRVLEGFLALAAELGKPAILHCRDKDDADGAYREMYDIMRGTQLKFVLHCFSGTPYWAEKFLELGGLLGVTGMVTFKKSDNIRETLRCVPPERLLLETDSPYLAPVPFRGKVNNPGFLPLIAARAAEVFGCSPEELAERTTRNAFEFFNIKNDGEAENV